MQSKMIIFPREDGFNVLIWGKWAQGSMRVRQFDTRSSMIALLENMRIITSEQSKELEDFHFTASCPMYSTEIDEETLAAHGFHPAQ